MIVLQYKIMPKSNYLIFDVFTVNRYTVMINWKLIISQILIFLVLFTKVIEIETRFSNKSSESCLLSIKHVLKIVWSHRF